MRKLLFLGKHSFNIYEDNVLLKSLMQKHFRIYKKLISPEDSYLEIEEVIVIKQSTKELIDTLVDTSHLTVDPQLTLIRKPYWIFDRWLYPISIYKKDQQLIELGHLSWTLSLSERSKRAMQIWDLESLDSKDFYILHNLNSFQDQRMDLYTMTEAISINAKIPFQDVLLRINQLTAKGFVKKDNDIFILSDKGKILKCLRIYY